MRVLRLIAVVGLVASCRSSCGNQPGDHLGVLPSVSVSNFGLSPQDAEKPVATVGSHVITVRDFMQTLADMPEFERLRYQSLAHRKALLQALIDMEVLADEAKRQRLDQDPIVQEEVRQVLVAWVREQLDSQLPKPDAIAPADVRAYYDQHLADYQEPERRRCAQIVLKDESTAKKAWGEAKFATATEWGALVKKYSIEPVDSETQAPEFYGDLGFVTKSAPSASPNHASQVVRDESFKLGAPGDVSEVFADSGRFRILRLLAKNEARTISFEDVQKSIRVKLHTQMRLKAEQDLLAQMRKTIPVTINDKVVDELAAVVTSGPAASTSGSH